MTMKDIQMVNMGTSNADAYDWSLYTLLCELHWWIGFFNIAFFKTQPVTKPTLTFEKKNVKNLGQYQKARNGFGLKEVININQCCLDKPMWHILSILIHEMCHSWQALYGSPAKSWFHNKEYRLKMAEIGIITDHQGRHLKLRDPFVFFLQKHGIDFGPSKDCDAQISYPLSHTPKGTSKLRKWQCFCGQSARVGKKDFYAVCTLCNQRFVMTK